MLFVLRNYRYLVLALIVVLLVLGTVILLPNFSLLSEYLLSGSNSSSDKLSLIWGLLSSLTTNFTVFSMYTTIITSVLVGINVSLIVYLYMRQKKQFSSGGVAVSSFGALLGIFGVGCAACGSLILTAILTTFGGVGLLALLPFGGQEFSILGIIVLGFATYLLIQKINSPLICEI